MDTEFTGNIVLCNTEAKMGWGGGGSSKVLDRLRKLGSEATEFHFVNPTYEQTGTESGGNEGVYLSKTKNLK